MGTSNKNAALIQAGLISVEVVANVEHLLSAGTPLTNDQKNLLGILRGEAAKLRATILELCETAMTDTARPADPQSKLTSEGAVAESPTSFQGSFGDYDLIGHPFKNGAGENSWHITCRAAGRSSAKTYCVIGKEFFSIGCEAGAPIEQGLNDNKPIQRLDDSDLDPQEREAILEATRKWQSSS